MPDTRLLNVLYLAAIFRRHQQLKGFAYSIMIFAAVSLAMYYPQNFLPVGDFKLSKLIILPLQISMFDMVSELSRRELMAVLKMPKGIIIGVKGGRRFAGWNGRSGQTGNSQYTGLTHPEDFNLISLYSFHPNDFL